MKLLHIKYSDARVDDVLQVADSVPINDLMRSYLFRPSVKSVRLTEDGKKVCFIENGVKHD